MYTSLGRSYEYDRADLIGGDDTRDTTDGAGDVYRNTRYVGPADVARDWLKSKWAIITGLPGRLDMIATEAQALVNVKTLPMTQRQKAARVLVDARADKAEVIHLLSKVRVSLPDSSRTLAGLAALPVIWVIGVSAVAIVTALTAIFGRASTYERELALIRQGVATPEDIEDLREGAPPGTGVAASLAEASGMLRLALVGAAGYLAWRTWG